MTSDEMFLSYRLLNPDVRDYDYCLIPGELIKSDEGQAAVSSSLFELCCQDVPSAGDIQAVEDSEGEALCLVRLTSVTVLRGREIADDVVCVPDRDDDGLYCLIGYRTVFR